MYSPGTKAIYTAKTKTKPKTEQPGAATTLH